VFLLRRGRIEVIKYRGVYFWAKFRSFPPFKNTTSNPSIKPANTKQMSFYHKDLRAPHKSMILIQTTLLS